MKPIISRNFLYPNTLCVTYNVSSLTFVSKRCMFSLKNGKGAISPIKLSSELINGQPQRFFPDKYKGHMFNLGESSNGIELDTKHIMIEHVPSGKIIARLTSQKFDHFEKANIRICAVKHDGSYTYAMTKYKKWTVDNYGNDVMIPNFKQKLIVDNYGFYVPHKIRGGQYLKFEKEPKEVENATLLKKIPKVNDYLNTIENDLDYHTQKSGILLKNSIKIK